MNSTRLTIKNDRFILDGSEFTILAGSIHYFRVHPEQWSDRLARLRAMGLNSIQTYVPWNFHEFSPGRVDLSSPSRHLARFLRLAQAHNLLVILRPGPYVCAELEFGGLPAWLLADGPVAIRTYAQPYLSHVDRWWGVLLPALKAEGLLLDDGGPVMMLQIENEYGHFGDASRNVADRLYLEHLVELARKYLGGGLILFTTDPDENAKLARGTLSVGESKYGDQVLTAVDSCDVPGDAWAAQRPHNPPGRSPFFCAELWVGWFAHWGEPLRPHLASQDAATVAARVRLTLGVNKNTGSVSLYMAHGGTNFEWWAGANTADGMYSPTITSYDYGAPLDEAGGHGIDTAGGDKYEAVRAVLLTRAAADTRSRGGGVLPPGGALASSDSARAGSMGTPSLGHSAFSFFAGQAAAPPPDVIPAEPGPPRHISAPFTVKLSQVIRLMEGPETLTDFAGGAEQARKESGGGAGMSGESTAGVGDGKQNGIMGGKQNGFVGVGTGVVGGTGGSAGLDGGAVGAGIVGGDFPALRRGALTPPPMEAVGCDQGLVVYETMIPAGAGGGLAMSHLRDRALVFLDGSFVGRVYRQQGWGRADPRGIPLPPPVPRPRRLSLLIENLGRVGFVDLPWSSPAYSLDQRKGILSGVLLNGSMLNYTRGGWNTTCLPLGAAQRGRLGGSLALRWQDAGIPPGGEQADADSGGDTAGVGSYSYPYGAGAGEWAPDDRYTSGAEMYRGLFSVRDADVGADAWLLLSGSGFGHGAAWVNGWGLGRFWESEGPTHSLYVPGPLLRQGENELLIWSADPMRKEEVFGGVPQIYNYAFTYTASKLAAVSARTAIGASFSKLEGLFSLFLTADLPADVLPAHPSGQLAGPPGPAAAGGILSFSLVAVLGAVWAWRRGTRSRRRHAGEHAARPAKWRRPTQEVLL